MSEKIVYNKLVLDGVPESILADGLVPITRVLDDDAEYIDALFNKVYEEVGEIRAAMTREERVQEVGDAIRALYALTTVYGITIAEIERARRKKEEERGCFDGRVFLESVIDPKATNL